ncbi:la protein homolog [[Candida] jaroonii]|uniref:La protein homolog n=1 Tax=[Candida] jaroonii TaxID=467808 RepID=A0ACA9Y9N2_9ASCO|nr:la protein homolog [[Candida] jaroonii]
MTENIYQGEDFEEKVKRQVEFYFSDSNLQTDRFLWKIYESNDGWVELKTILTFGRMRQYRPEEKVIEALKSSDKLKLSANNEMVSRNDPVKDFNELKNQRKRNTVHIEGFPKDLTQEDLEEFFNKKISPSLPESKEIGSIRRIRNRKTKEFFGVVDVEFKSSADSEYFLNELEVSYPIGLINDENRESVDKKDILNKMSLLTFQEMKENGKRFGVNEVTKRKNSFNSKNDVKVFRKNQKKNDESKKESGSEEIKEESEAQEDKTEEPSEDKE